MNRVQATNGHGRRPSSSASRGVAQRELTELLGAIVEHVRSVAESARKLALIRWRVFQLRTIDAALGVAALGLAWLAGATTVVAASLLVVAGLRHALARASGAEWVGELGGGALSLLLLLLVAGIARRAARRRLLARAPQAHATRSRAPESEGAAP